MLVLPNITVLIVYIMSQPPKVSSGARVAGSASSHNDKYGGDMGNVQVRSDDMQMMSGGGGGAHVVSGGAHVVSGGSFSGGTEVRTEVRTSRRSHKRH